MNSDIRERVRIGKCDLKNCAWIFIIILLLLFALIFSCLAHSEWIYSNLGYSLRISKSDEGPFKLKCGVLICYNPEVISYHELSKHIKEPNNLNTGEKASVSLQSVKSKLSLLNLIGLSAVILYSFCLITLAIWLTTIVLFLKNRNAYWYSWISSFFSCVYFFIGSVLWFALTPSQFKSCNYITEKGPVGVYCSSTGPVLMIVIMIILFFTTISYLIISIKAYRRQNFNTNAEEFRINVSTNPISDINRISKSEFNSEEPKGSQTPDIKGGPSCRLRGNFSLCDIHYNEIYENFNVEHLSGDSKQLNKICPFISNRKDHFSLENSNNSTSSNQPTKNPLNLCVDQDLRNRRLSPDFDTKHLVKISINKFVNVTDQERESDGIIVYDDGNSLQKSKKGNFNDRLEGIPEQEIILSDNEKNPQQKYMKDRYADDEDSND